MKLKELQYVNQVYEVELRAHTHFYLILFGFIISFDY